MSNASQLAMRDPAFAALMGSFAGGASADFGADFGDDIMGEMGLDFGEDTSYGADPFGADFGAAVKHHLAKKAAPHPAAVAALIAHHVKKKAHTDQRKNLIEPNANSEVKVEKYSFTLSQAITLGTAVAFSTLTGNPDTTIRPQRVSMNSPTPMFAFIQEIKVANVSVTIGPGVEDAYDYNANGVGQALDMPTLNPQNKATILGNYTGYVPPGFAAAFSTFFMVSFKGPATIIA